MIDKNILKAIELKNNFLKESLNFSSIKLNKEKDMILKICDIGLNKYQNNFFIEGNYKVDLYLQYINNVKDYIYTHIYMQNNISLNNLLGLHKEIMGPLKNETIDTIGGLREIPIITKEKNFLTGLNEAFISHYKVKKKTNEAISYYNENIDFDNKLEIITKTYIQFLSKIHIFENGNGRLMFILLDTLLFKYNYLPIFIRYHEYKWDKISEEYIKHRNINKLQRNLLKIILEIYSDYKII